MNRLFICLLCLLSFRGAFAIGLGELNTQPVLGEPLHLEVNITGAGKDVLHASCFRVTQPASADDIPWVKSATLALRKGARPVLEIRSPQIIHEPILALAVHVACGQDMVREYMLLVSPVREVRVADKLASLQVAPPPLPAAALEAKRPVESRRVVKREVDSAPVQPVRRQRPSVSRVAVNGEANPDRLVLSGGAEVGDPALRFSPVLSTVSDQAVTISETQREMLRLEFRMLLALQEQALTQLEAGEKLMKLDKALLALQKNAAEQEKGLASVAPGRGANPDVIQPKTLAVAAAVPPPVDVEEASMLEGWWVYALLFSALAGVGAWLGWKNRHGRHGRRPLLAEFMNVPVVHEDESVAPVMAGNASKGGERIDPVLADDAVAGALRMAEPSVTNATDLLDAIPFVPPVEEEVSEHAEATPVMELADVMLSFGRVKGAAQALQEFIDANPKEALQPWVRLLDVYRMAGMRSEFEALALNLNKNFNVEVQYWDKSEPVEKKSNSIDFVLEETVPGGGKPPRAHCLEDMPHVLQQIIVHWQGDGAIDCIHQLLRDNRGGSRLGFALEVVEEMLFLIELKETIIRMERDRKTV